MRKEDFYEIIPKEEVCRIVGETELPAFIYFGKIIKKKYEELLECLPKGFEINYAFKANPNREVLGLIRSLGAGADVASLGELRLALETGYPPEKIEFTGPGKSLDELSLAIDARISSVNAESVSEIRKIANLCRMKKRTANVGIRLNPRTRPSASAIKMGGDTQFGIVENDVEEALSIIKSEGPSLHFTGLHMHLGSQYQETEKLIANFRFILDKTSEILNRCDIKMKKINFGGGWGIDMFGRKPPLDLLILKQALFEIFSDPLYTAVFEHTRFIIEPGRFLVAECGLYATEVMYRKKGYQREFLVVNGGMHQHYAAAGGIGQVIRRNYEIDSLPEEKKNGQKRPYFIAGSLCIPDDILAAEISLPCSTDEGDILLFFNSGAYGLSASPLEFLSHPLPQEVVI